MKTYKWTELQSDDRVDITVKWEGQERTFFLKDLPVDPTRRSLRIELAVHAFVNELELLQSSADLRAHIEELTLSAQRILAEKKPAPPRLAENCVSFFAPKNTAQALLGDMQEMFQKNVNRLGEKEARRLYWMEVRASAGRLLWEWVKRVGFFTVIIDYVRQKFGL